MCVVCGVDAGLRGAVLICVTAQSAADLVNYTDNIISRGQCKSIPGLQNKVDGRTQSSVLCPHFHPPKFK